MWIAMLRVSSFPFLNKTKSKGEIENVTVSQG